MRTNGTMFMTPEWVMGKKPAKVYRIWCEWDISISHSVYETRELANMAAEHYDWESLDSSYEEVLEHDLIGIDELTFITEPERNFK